MAFVFWHNKQLNSMLGDDLSKRVRESEEVSLPCTENPLHAKPCVGQGFCSYCFCFNTRFERGTHPFSHPTGRSWSYGHMMQMDWEMSPLPGQPLVSSNHTLARRTWFDGQIPWQPSQRGPPQPSPPQKCPFI